MKEFTVYIAETLSRAITLEAEDEFEAFDKVIEQYYNSEIILDADDFVDVEFK
jgi:hypothetical protein